MLALLSSLAQRARLLVPRVDDDRGATAVEFGLMVVLIVVALIGMVFLFGGNLGSLFSGEAATPGGR